VYTPADRDVVPARLQRPQMPKEPAPGSDTGYFDILVDEQGSVEEVRLLSPTRRYYDRMLVAAAKAWKFTPARLNGQPVKYRVRVPIIVPVMPW
jgi:TonB family protein